MTQRQAKNGGQATNGAVGATGGFALVGPSPRGDRSRLPVRGDLAHIRLAGRWFVPAYAEPIMRRLVTSAVLRAAAKPDGAALATLRPGDDFAMLDIAGGWAWGQVGRGEDGWVGYLPVAALAEA